LPYDALNENAQMVRVTYNKKDSKFLAVLGLAYVVGNSVLFAKSKELTTVTWIE
jgi:hypothetical protein